MYDAANRLESLNGQPVYTFDDNGNLLNSDTLTNTFDAANRLINTTNSTNSLTPIYNGIGDRVGQTVGVSTTNYALDVAAGLPEVIYTSQSEVYLHLPGVIVAESAAAETRYLLGNGLEQVLTYDESSFRPKTVTAGSVQQLEFGFDPLGRLKSFKDNRHGLHFTDYQYDILGCLDQVLAATYPQDYHYDPIGNLTLIGDTNLTFAHPTKPHAVSQSETDGVTTTYDYDANGNLIMTMVGSTVQTVYRYDAENRLAEVQKGSQTVSFVYDGEGQQIMRTGADNSVTLYVGSHYQETILSSGTSAEETWPPAPSDWSIDENTDSASYSLKHIIYTDGVNIYFISGNNVFQYNPRLGGV